MAKLPGIFLFLSLDPLRDPLREKEGEREREICRRNCILAVEFESIIGIDSLICAIFVYLCTLEYKMLASVNGARFLFVLR